MKFEKKTKNWGSKETFNLVKGKSIVGFNEAKLSIAAVAIGEDMSNETGEVIATGYMYDTDGNCFTTISKTCRHQLEALIDIIDEEKNPIDVQVCLQSCKQDNERQFVYLDMI